MLQAAEKRAIASLITQLYHLPQQGVIRIDRTPIDIRDYDIASLATSHCFCTTRCLSFSRGLAISNLTWYEERCHTDISADRMIRVRLREIGAFRFHRCFTWRISSTTFKNAALSLSQGQRQLISFIRALAVDPDIIVLDEATSAIDSQTEHLIQKAIELLLKDRTAVVIAHRLSTIKHCNEIMVLEKGEILEKGTHQELMKEKGAYQHLYSTQIESVQ